MNEHLLLPIPSGLETAILALNNAYASELSWLAADNLAALVRGAFYARRIGEIDAFFSTVPTIRLGGSGRCRTGHAGRGDARLLSAGPFHQARRAGLVWGKAPCYGTVSL